MILLESNKLVEKILNKIKKQNLKKFLVVVCVGKNPVLESFVKQKERACKRAHIKLKVLSFSGKIAQKKIEKEIKKIAEDETVGGIVVELPLPKKLVPEKIFNSIPLEKDIDFLSQETIEEFKKGKLKIFPPVVCAVSRILKEYRISLKKKKIVLLGKGKLTGLPLSIWLSKIKADFFVVDKKTRNKIFLIKKADIIISAIGKPNFIKKEMIKKGAVVIDIGRSFKKGRLVGDVDFRGVFKKASFVTPLFGGIGPLVVACLLENFAKVVRN